MARTSKEFQAFDRTVKQLLTVPRSTLEQRMAEHRAQSAQNPRKRGPKPKVTPSASDPDAGNENG